MREALGTDSNLIRDFIRRFGEDEYRTVLARAGNKSSKGGLLAMSDELGLPSDREKRLIFSLLEEMSFGDGNKKLKEFLKDHRKKIKNMKIPLPSVSSAVDGTYDFLLR